MISFFYINYIYTEIDIIALLRELKEKGFIAEEKIIAWSMQI